MSEGRTPGKWHWHDGLGRKDGKGEPIGIGRGLTDDEPQTGSVSRFAYVVTDDQGFVIARCSNALVTMSDSRSEANARLIARSADLLEACKEQMADYWGIDLQRLSKEEREKFNRLEAAIAEAEGRTPCPTTV